MASQRCPLGRVDTAKPDVTAMSVLPFPEGATPERCTVVPEAGFRKTVVLMGTDEWEAVDVDSGSEAFSTPEA